MLIRKAKVEDAKALANIKVETWRKTYQGLISDEYINSLDKEDSETKWINTIKDNKDIILVAELDDIGHVVGYAYGGVNRKESDNYGGELYALYVLPDCQSKNIGTYLVESFVNELLDEGYTTMNVWHVKGNSVGYFYEKLGGKTIGSSKIEIANQSYDIVGYAWENLNNFKLCY